MWHAILKVKHVRPSEVSCLSALPYSLFSSALLAPQGTDTLCSRMGCTSPLHAQDLHLFFLPSGKSNELNFHQEKEAHCACKGSWVFGGGVDKNIPNFPVLRQKIHAAARTQASSLSHFVVKFPLESKNNNSSASPGWVAGVANTCPKKPGPCCWHYPNATTDIKT